MSKKIRIRIQGLAFLVVLALLLGLAVGRAVRFSIVAVNIIDLFLSLAIWGSTTTVRIAG